MTEIQNGIYATPTDELTALALEARKRKISYGQLVSTTTGYEQQQIIRQYCIERGKKGTAPEKKAAQTKKKRSKVCQSKLRSLRLRMSSASRR